MRKNYQMWLLGALVGGLVLPFAGCSNEDDPMSNGPGSGETVKTQLALLVTGHVGTKAAAEEMDNVFDGMTNIHLVSYEYDADDKVTSGSTFVSDIELADFDVFNTEASATPTSNIKIYDNVSLPKQKVNFMFYGKSGFNSYATPRNLKVNIATTNPSETSFELNELTFDDAATTDEVTAMTNYIDAVLETAATVINTSGTDETKTKFENYVENVTSPALYQVGYLMAQLYFDSDFEQISGWDDVKTAIASDADNFVFKSISSGIGGISDLMKLINTGNEKYLGADFPVGGKILSITVDYSGNDNSKVTTVIKSGANEGKYKYPTPLYFMANTYPVEYEGEDYWNELSGKTILDLSTNPAKIALKDQIEFAVGKLSLKFNIGSDIQGNDPTIGYDHLFNTGDLEVVGIFLNNQESGGWNFLPKSTDGIVYDNVVSSTDLGMLALATTQNEVVKFVLEVKNNTDYAFKGVNGGIIPGGATFYLSGELNPAQGTGSVIAENAPAVFSPDYETIVTVNLTSLAKAENTVPDLSAANLQLALSVDMEWKQGYYYTVEIGAD